MSGSVVLYLAIVVMWLCVLVPMWLRRDRSNLAELEEYYAGEITEPVPVAGLLHDAVAEEPAAPVADVRRLRARRRAIIVARRRRMLFFSALLIVASVVTAAVAIIPWWGVAPAGLLLLSYLGVLRIASRVDRERRERAAEARARYMRRQRDRLRAEELAASQAEAEIIAFAAREADVLFDQYAEPPRRAVGD
jgi:hypothetical protein